MAMKIWDAASQPSFDAAATAVSKSYIFLFFIYCGVIGYLDSPNIGLWWIAVLAIGMFAASLVFAMPATWVKLALVTKLGIGPTGAGWFLYRAIDTAGYVALWFVTRYAINALSG
jgi:hypothetical protein